MLVLADSEQQLIQQLLDTLQALPGVHADMGRHKPAGPAHDHGYDAEIDTRIAAKSLTQTKHPAAETVNRRAVVRWCWCWCCRGRTCCSGEISR